MLYAQDTIETPPPHHRVQCGNKPRAVEREKKIVEILTRARALAKVQKAKVQLHHTV